jgi:hypothetical protein
MTRTLFSNLSMDGLKQMREETHHTICSLLAPSFKITCPVESTQINFHKQVASKIYK